MKERHILIRDSKAALVHGVKYSSEWYGDKLKDGGGWSLEIIDTVTRSLRKATGGHQYHRREGPREKQIPSQSKPGYDTSQVLRMFFPMTAVRSASDFQNQLPGSEIFLK